MQTQKSTHLNAFLTAKVRAQTLYGDVYLKMKSTKSETKHNQRKNKNKNKKHNKLYK